MESQQSISSSTKKRRIEKEEGKDLYLKMTGKAIQFTKTKKNSPSSVGTKKPSHSPIIKESKLNSEQHNLQITHLEELNLSGMNMMIRFAHQSAGNKDIGDSGAISILNTLKDHSKLLTLD